MAYVIASRFGADIPTGCRELCYDGKSVKYKVCQGIPPVERQLREDCFANADKDLRACLGRCPPSKIGGAAVVAATALTAALLLK